MRRPLVALFILLAGVTAPRHVYAQERVDSTSAVVAGARTMTLSEAIAFAHAHQPAIRAAMSRIEAARADAGVPRGEWLPTLGVTAQIFAATPNNTTGTYVQPWFMDVPRIGGTRSTDAGSATFRPYASTFAGAGIEQELFDFGRIAAESAAADANVDVATKNENAVRLDVDFSVEEAFYAEIAAKAVLAASDDAYERARVHRDLAQAGVNSGLRSPIELTRAEAELGALDIDRIRARGGVTVAQTVLAASIGAPDLRVDASAPPAASQTPTLQEAVARATSHDPRLAATIAELRARELETKAVRAQMRPDIGGTATISARAGGAPPSSGPSADYDGFLPTVPNWDAGLVFSWPLFDGTNDARVTAAHARETVARDEVTVAKQEIVAEVERAYVGVQVAREALPGLQHAVAAAIANYAQADARFKAGLGTSVELADAESLRTDAEIALARGVFDLARARAVLGRAIAEGI